MSQKGLFFWKGKKMEYNLKTKPLSEETLTFYDIYPDSYIQLALYRKVVIITLLI